MRVLIQRVSNAKVTVDGKVTGEIGRGLLLLVGITHGDTEAELEWMVSKLSQLRIFSDTHGKMNLSVRDIGGGVLAVSQFTLAADTQKGLRPSFSCAAPPEQAADLFDRLVNNLRERHTPVACGVFAADMQVHLVNDGPVTFLLEQ